MLELNNNELTTTIQELLYDYASTCGEEFFDGQIIIAEDMRESYIQLRGDLVKKGVSNINDIEKYHGLTVQPADNDGIFTILLNKKIYLRINKE